MTELHFHIDETAGFTLLSKELIHQLAEGGWTEEEIEGRNEEIFLTACELVRGARQDVRSKVRKLVRENSGEFSEEAARRVVRRVYVSLGNQLAGRLNAQRQSLCN